MSNNQSYIPSLVVRSVHNIPHLNAQLHRRNGAFGMTSNSRWNEYTLSLLPMPIICGGVGLLAVFFFQLIFSLYYFWKKRSTLPYIHDHRIPTDPLRNCRIAFVLIFVIITVYVQSIPVGNNYLTTGVSNSEGRLDYLDSTFTSLTTEGNDLLTDGEILDVNFDNSYTINNCAAAQQLDDFLPAYYASVQEYLSYVEDVPEQVADLQDRIHLYAVKYKNRAVWIFYGLFILVSDAFFVGMFFNSRRVVFSTIGVAELLMSFAFLVCGAGMVVMMLVADFCMDPTANLLQVSPPNLYNTTLYYTSCLGENPMQPSLTSAEQLIDQTDAAVHAALDTTCPGDVYLLDSLQVISTIKVAFADIESLIVCDPTQDAVLGVMNGSFCKDTYKGVYTIWMTIFVCAACLFAMTVVSAIASQYFPKSSDAAKTEAAHIQYQTAGGEYESYTPHNTNPDGDCPHDDAEAEAEEGLHGGEEELGEGKEAAESESSSPVHSRQASPTAATSRKLLEGGDATSSKNGPEVVWV